MLRDDPWNTYTYNTATGRFDFHWYWLECCTDGMVLGPMPDATVASTGFNVTYEADCANMVGLEQGTRISMWNPLGPAYNPGGCNGAPLLGNPPSPMYNQHGNRRAARGQLDPLRRADVADVHLDLWHPALGATRASPRARATPTAARAARSSSAAGTRPRASAAPSATSTRPA